MNSFFYIWKMQIHISGRKTYLFNQFLNTLKTKHVCFDQFFLHISRMQIRISGTKMYFFNHFLWTFQTKRVFFAQIVTSKNHAKLRILAPDFDVRKLKWVLFFLYLKNANLYLWNENVLFNQFLNTFQAKHVCFAQIFTSKTMQIKDFGFRFCWQTNELFFISIWRI